MLVLEVKEKGQADPLISPTISRTNIVLVLRNIDKKMQKQVLPGKRTLKKFLSAPWKNTFIWGPER